MRTKDEINEKIKELEPKKKATKEEIFFGNLSIMTLNKCLDNYNQEYIEQMEKDFIKYQGDKRILNLIKWVLDKEQIKY